VFWEEQISRMVRRGRLHGVEAIQTQVQRALKQYRVRKYCRVTVREDGFDYQIDRKALRWPSISC